MRRHDELIEAALQAQRCIARAQHAAADPAWLQLDLTMGQLKALFVLADGASTVGGLAGALGIGKPAASILVDRLFQVELITREEDPCDRRRTLVRLTPRGHELVAQLRQGSEERLRNLLSQLAEGDLAALVQGLQALAQITASSPGRVASRA
jgi:DNA-binding MarR family transcriptional regulator